MHLFFSLPYIFVLFMAPQPAPPRRRARRPAPRRWVMLLLPPSRRAATPTELLTVPPRRARPAQIELARRAPLLLWRRWRLRRRRRRARQLQLVVAPVAERADLRLVSRFLQPQRRLARLVAVDRHNDATNLYSSSRVVI